MSQEDFAKKALRTRSEIKNIEYNKTTPKDEVIQSVCSAHNINEIWLRTGEGEMFCPRTQSDDLSAFFGKLLSIDDANLKSRLVTALSHVSPEGWAALEKFIDELTEQKKETDS